MPIDEVTNWVIDRAEPTPGGYLFWLTDLIPPNNAHGDKSKITLLLDENGNARIPEWKRGYKRCPQSSLSAE